MATLTLIVVATRWTDHRLSLIGTKVKQLGFAPAQLVQKPPGLSFQVPDFEGPPAEPVGSRNALPSGVKVILNLVPLGVAAMNGSPLKNAALISLGRIASAARAAVGAKLKTKTAVRKSMVVPPAKASGEPNTIGRQQKIAPRDPAGSLHGMAVWGRLDGAKRLL